MKDKKSAWLEQFKSADKTKPICITIDTKTLQMLEDIAKVAKTSKSNVIRVAIESLYKDGSKNAK